MTAAVATAPLDSIESTILRLRRIRSLIERARVSLDVTWKLMSRCASEIASTPEKYAAAPWRPVGQAATRPAAHFFYFSGSRCADTRDGWSLGCGILGRGDAPVNLELGERALQIQWHWEHCARRVSALVATYESEFRKAVEL